MEDKKLLIEKAIVLIIAFEVMVNLGFELYYYRLPYWLEDFSLPDFSQLSNVLLRLVTYISAGFVMAGIARLIKLKEIRLLKEFSFPIYVFTIQTIYLILFFSFSSKFSYFGAEQNLTWFVIFLRILNLILLVLVLYYFTVMKTRNTEIPTKSVKQSSRFLNRLIDLTLIFAFSFSTIDALARNHIFENIPFFNSNFYWILALYMFVYYFILEFVFLQTIGKIHNNSFVSYERNKFKSILIRTFGRFIPFNAFSFFGKKGWHDGISETSVVIEDND